MTLYLRDKENIQKGYDVGMKKGMEKGITKGRMETAYNMAEMGMDVGTIANILKEDVEVINRWLLVETDEDRN